MYHSKFYEYQALQEIARSHEVKANIRIPSMEKDFDNWKEVDGFYKKKGKNILIEVKSYCLNDSDVERIMNKYKKIEIIDDLLIIAPEISVDKNYDFRFKEFEPDLSKITKFYKNFNPDLPEIFKESINWHHFRFQSPYRKGSFRNQVDKRITDTIDLKKEINKRLSWPPLRVFWSTMKWLSPKDLYNEKSNDYCLGGPIVFDIDCSKIHYPCKITDEGICEEGVELAHKEAKKLVDFLKKENYEEVRTVFSGRRGFHVYVFDTKCEGKKYKEERIELLDKIKREGIKADYSVTSDIKRVIGFPTSLHGISMKKIKILN